MAEGFKIAEAYVELETEDNIGRGLAQATNTVTVWGRNLADLILRQFRDAFADGGTAATRQVQQATGAMERDLDRLTSQRREIRIDVDRDQISGAGTAISGLIGLLQRGASRAVDFGMQIGSSLAAAATSGTAMTAATGGLNILIGALIAAAGAAALALTGFTLLAPAILLVGGGAGAAATGLVGLIGLFAVFKLGVRGISDALGEFWENGEITAETLKKLSPAAREFVGAISALKPKFDALQQSIQNALLKDMGKVFSDLAGKWLPMLTPMLTSLASRVNEVGKSIALALGKPDFISNIRKAMEGFGRFLTLVGANIDQVISAFGKIAAAAEPFLVEIGRLIGDAFEKFNAWITRAEESGALQSFFENAVQALKDLWAIGGLVFGIVGEIIAILFPGSDRAADSVFGGIRDQLEKVKAWLSDPANKQAIQDFIQDIQDKIQSVIAWFQDPANQEAIQMWIDRIKGWASTAEGWIDTVETWVDKVQGWIDKIKGWGEAIATWIDEQKAKWEEFKTSVSEKIDAVSAFFQQLPGRIIGFLAGLPAMVIGLFASMMSQVAYQVGYGVGAAVAWFQQLPGRVMAAISALPGQLSAFWSGVRASMTSIASSAVDSVRNVFATAPGKIAGALSGVRNAVIGAFAGAGGWLMSAGSAIISGLVAGIGSAAGAAVAAARNIASSIVSGVMDGLEVGSPSKVMRDDVGRWIPPGIVEGVQAAMPKAVAQVGHEVQALAQMPAFGHAEARATTGGGGGRPSVVVNMAGANFYGVGSAREYVAQMQDALARYEQEYR